MRKHGLALDMRVFFFTGGLGISDGRYGAVGSLALMV